MKQAKEKSIGLAIGLNFVLPGLGYMYMGRVIVGIAGLLLIIAMYALYFQFLLPAWIGMNAIMAIDMLILGRKNKNDIQTATMKKCPKCAEFIKKEATVCRYCNAVLFKNET